MGRSKASQTTLVHHFRDPKRQLRSARLTRSFAALCRQAYRANFGIELDAKMFSNLSCDYSVELIHGCYHEYLQAYKFCGTELVYEDLSHLKSTRKAPDQYHYHCDYEESDHIELPGILTALPCQVMMSGYQSD